MHFHYDVMAWNDRMEDSPDAQRGGQQHNVSIAQFTHERAPSFRLAQNLQSPSNGRSG